jgi:hypothetical protein
VSAGPSKTQALGYTWDRTDENPPRCSPPLPAPEDREEHSQGEDGGDDEQVVLTTAGKGYAATGRQTPRPGTAPAPADITTHPARQRRGPAPGGRIGGAMRSSPQRANRASPGRCCLRHVP